MDPNDIGHLADQAGIGVLAVYALQLLKGSKYFPWINANSAKVNRILSAAIAVATSVGITVAGNHNVGWTITIPDIHTLFVTFSRAATQYAGQQMLYHTTVKDTIGGLRSLETDTMKVDGAVIQVASGKAPETPETHQSPLSIKPTLFKDDANVLSREECIYRYCPTRDLCEGKCKTPRKV